nr:16S rRNA (cytosine(967)-C(5))-methyltransferase RsmB [Azospira restricta]
MSYSRLRTPSRPAAPPALAADSLAYSLLLAARAVAAVLGGSNLPDALAGHAGEPAAARAAAQDLAYGALRRFAQGDALLAALIARPLAQPEPRALLLCALYRLETRPEAAHTVVDQAVEAAGRLANGAFRGLVNGVLRNYLRRRDELLSGLTGDEARHWHPAWWLRRLRTAYPDAWPGIVAAGNGLPPMALRVNRRRCSRDDYLAQLAAAGIAARPTGTDGILLDRPQPVDALPGFFAGLASVQDPGAQRAAELLDVAAGQRVLDACAAPGGKAAHLLERADVALTALDVDARRARRIEENLGRLGLAATVRVADARQVRKWWDGVPFERILADVPCSASGVVRRHPDAKWLRREDDIAGFAATQRQILGALWPTLAPGGKLLYATCSVFPEENQEQVAGFLAAEARAELVAEEQLLPQGDHDGFYYALLQKAR